MRCRRGSCAGAWLTTERASARPPCGADHEPARPDAELGGLGQRAAAPGPARDAAVCDLLGGHDRVGHGRVAAPPTRPLADRRPSVGHGRRADDEPEVPGAQRQLVDLGARRGAADRAHRVRVADRVGRADDGEHRQVDVGEGDQAVVDDEAALEHPVVLEVHLEELRDGRP